MTVGWFWYLGTLIPVIGLVQAGMQAHADRYMYVPMIGLLVILAWGGRGSRQPLAVDEVGNRDRGSVWGCRGFHGRRRVARYTALYWRTNADALRTRDRGDAGPNWVAENDLGIYYRLFPSRYPDAIIHFQNAMLIVPNYAAARGNLGAALMKLEGCASAIPHLEAAVGLNPKLSSARYTLAQCEVESGGYAAALPHLEELIRATPESADAHAVSSGIALSFEHRAHLRRSSLAI